MEEVGFALNAESEGSTANVHLAGAVTAAGIDRATKMERDSGLSESDNYMIARWGRRIICFRRRQAQTEGKSVRSLLQCAEEARVGGGNSAG